MNCCTVRRICFNTWWDLVVPMIVEKLCLCGYPYSWETTSSAGDEIHPIWMKAYLTKGWKLGFSSFERKPCLTVYGSLIIETSGKLDQLIISDILLRPIRRLILVGHSWCKAVTGFQSKKPPMILELRQPRLIIDYKKGFYIDRIVKLLAKHADYGGCPQPLRREYLKHDLWMTKTSHCKNSFIEGTVPLYCKVKKASTTNLNLSGVHKLGILKMCIYSSTTLRYHPTQCNRNY